MNVDKFGHHIFKRQKMNNYFESSMGLTDEGYLNAKNRTIKHIGNPTDPEDCATKQYVDKAIDSLFNKLSITLKSTNQTLTQIASEINSLKQNIDLISQRSKKK